MANWLHEGTTAISSSDKMVINFDFIVIAFWPQVSVTSLVNTQGT